MVDELAAALRGSGRRLTPQRQLVLSAVTELGHATPDEVHAHVRDRVSSVNLSTVYRALEVLEGLGLVRHTHLSDRAPTYHSITDHEHFHLVCRGCQKVTSVDPALAGPLVEALRQTYDFVPDLGHLAVFGRCLACPESADEADDADEADEAEQEMT